MKKNMVGLAVLLGVYVASYALNSSMGGYWPIHDLLRADAGLEPEHNLWQMRYGYYSARWSSPIGSLYRPLIQLDWRLVHKPRFAFDDEHEEWLYKTGPLIEFHPNSREYVEHLRKIRSELGPRKKGASWAEDYELSKKYLQSMDLHPMRKLLEQDVTRLMREAGWQ